ncbi:MAG: nitrous oxide reductase accessory protein NosL [Bacteroidota bacterium]
MKRRQFLLAGTTIAAAATVVRTASAAEGDGTPRQFEPKKPKDANPLDNEFEKYGKCPYCGMDRKQYHYSRHLIHYSDDLVDGTCSLRCAAVSLSLNLDRGPKMIYAPDNGSGLEIKPLTNAETAFYVIGGDHKPVMTKVAKTPFASKVAADAAKGSGEVVDFDRALMLTYMALAEDTRMTRMRREEKRKAAAGAAQPMHDMKH